MTVHHFVTNILKSLPIDIWKRLKDSDINQKGILGDCWFLSALSSLAVYDQRLIERVLNVQYNSQNGPTRGKLKVRDLRTSQSATPGPYDGLH